MFTNEEQPKVKEENDTFTIYNVLSEIRKISSDNSSAMSFYNLLSFRLLFLVNYFYQFYRRIF